MPSVKVSEAYTILGVEEGSSLELVKTAYKQVALRTHPDKNPDNPSATTEFQRVGEAYRVLVKHLDASSHTHNCGNPNCQYNSDDDDEYEFYDSDSDYEEGIDFYSWLFEKMMNDNGYYYKRPQRNAHRTPYYPEEKHETPEQYQERIRRLREDQLASQERRKREAIARKERAAREREQERQDAEKRQKNKFQEKKAKAEATRKTSEERARALKAQAQEYRTSVFTAARKADAEAVKKGIWEHGVDAAGGEVKIDYTEFAKVPPKDPKETLLHIAAKNGDLELVKWLDSHSADPEERDSQDLTAFHIALKRQHISIVSYFVDAYPPADPDSKPIYDCSESPNLLSMALNTCEPELVWTILEYNMATSNEILEAWNWVSSEQGMKTLQGAATFDNVQKAEDIRKLLMRAGDFSSPKLSAQNPKEASPAPGAPQSAKPRGVPNTAQGSHSRKTVPPVKHNASSGRGRGGGRGRGRGRGGHPVPPAH